MDGREGRPPPPNPAMPYREDCWSEGATAALIDAWGDRYLELNRGNLRQKDWQEVADSVNSRRGGARRPPRTDSQCKNRIDTLKKKYKIERSRIADSGGSVSSQWPFFSQLATLIGASGAPSSGVGAKRTPLSISSPPLALPIPSHRKASPLPLPAARPVEPSARERRPVTALPVNDSFFRRNYSAAAAAAAAAVDADSASSASSSRERSRSSMERPRPAKPVKRWRENRDEDRGVEVGIRQLAQAIVRFAESYEKVEAEKQRQMMELEKQRMDFAKGLEFQKMQIFVDTQVQIERIKRARRGDAARDLEQCFGIKEASYGYIIFIRSRVQSYNISNMSSHLDLANTCASSANS